MKKIGKDISSAEYWADKNTGYVEALAGTYHQHRLSVARDLIQPFTPAGAVVLDFGCGDGVMLDDFPGATKIGVEPDAGLMALARGRDPSSRFIHGGPESLSQVDDASVDLVLSLNVNAYLTDEQDATFYRHVARVLKLGGALVITHSNALFDLFTLNAYTAQFFRDEFDADVASLLAQHNEPNEPTYNVRENPLTYGSKLAGFGLAEERQGFINFHEKPPLLGKDRSIYLDTLKVPEDQRWKLMFQCSTFGSRSVKA